MTDDRLDRLLDDFGRELAQAGRRPQRRSALRRRRTLALAAAPALAAVAVALLAWPGSGGSGLDVIAEARAALTPSDDEIVHLVITTIAETPDGRRQEPQASEQWSATNPTRWRSASEVSGVFVASAEPFDPDAEPVTDRLQQSYRPGEFRDYLARSNVLSVLLGPAADQRSDVPSPLGLGDGDPVSELAGMLASGQLRDTGTVESGGRTVRRLVGTTTGVHVDGTPRQVVFDVDPETFAPIAGSTTIVLGGDRRIVTRFEVQRYERLPLDDETAQLLRIPTDRDTKVVAERGGADLVERGVCRHQPGAGDVICRPPESGRPAPGQSTPAPPPPGEPPPPTPGPAP